MLRRPYTKQVPPWTRETDEEDQPQRETGAKGSLKRKELNRVTNRTNEPQDGHEPAAHLREAVDKGSP